MRHRFQSKVFNDTIRFRCKRCGVSVNMHRNRKCSPYKECEELGIPTDCNISVVTQIMES